MKNVYCYVASQLRGDEAKHINLAIQHARFLLEWQRSKGFNQIELPKTSHVEYPLILNDSDFDDRELGLQAGLDFIEWCERVHVFIKNNIVSSGMMAEISWAKTLDKPIVYWLYSEEEWIYSLVEGVVIDEGLVQSVGSVKESIKLRKK